MRLSNASLGHAAQMLPFLGPVLGRGKLGNFLIRNKWRNYDAIRRLKHVPMLMLSAGQVCCRPGAFHMLFCRGFRSSVSQLHWPPGQHAHAA